MLTYSTDHPNQAHQFVMSVSKHYYAGTDGTLKYQKKAMETSLNKISASPKRNMVIYSLRDHCTGVFYSELSFGPNIEAPHLFLDRAWRPKDDFPFHGIPDLLSLPRTVQAQFPDLPNKISHLGIQLVDVTSGFQGGVRDIRTIESGLSFLINQPIHLTSDWLKHIYLRHSQDKLRSSNSSKISLWSAHVPTIRLPPDDWYK